MCAHRTDRLQAPHTSLHTSLPLAGPLTPPLSEASRKTWSEPVALLVARFAAAAREHELDQNTAPSTNLHPTCILLLARREARRPFLPAPLEMAPKWSDQKGQPQSTLLCRHLYAATCLRLHSPTLLPASATALERTSAQGCNLCTDFGCGYGGRSSWLPAPRRCSASWQQVTVSNSTAPAAWRRSLAPQQEPSAQQSRRHSPGRKQEASCFLSKEGL